MSTEPHTVVTKLNKKYGLPGQSCLQDLLKHIEDEVGNVICGWKEEVFDYAEMIRDYRFLTGYTFINGS